MIVCDPRNSKAEAVVRELRVRLPSDFGGDALAIVIGGDGFLLRTAAELGFDVVYLGLNCGRLGFLLNDLDDDWDGLAHRIATRAWREHRFPLLEATLDLTDGSVLRERAINDVYLERATGQAAVMALSIDGHSVVESMVADGLIFATALGSTAYSFSSGGTPHHPELEVLSVTPICPHLPRLMPFAVPSSVRAVVQIRDAEARPVRAVADGRELGDVRRAEIAFSDEVVRMAYFDSHDFTRQMVRKIVLP